MRLRRYILLSTFIIGGAVSSAIMAQNISRPCPVDLELRYPWLTSENAAGLTVLSAKDRASEVCLYGEYFYGDMHNYNKAGEGYKWGLKALSYYSVSERIAVSGEIDYSSFRGKDMTGSYFIDPAQTPFNLIEFTKDNKGDKLLETYHLSGAVGAKFTNWLSGGLKMDYTASNYAKQKDLRHTNSLMDMTLTAGLNFCLTDRLTLGINYSYRRRNESLLLSMYGTTDQLYYSLIDYGSFFGKRELFGDTGYTKENEAKPLFDSYHGGSLQFSWHISDHWDWFNEVGFRLRDGFYGEDSPSTVVYSTHQGNLLVYNGHLVHSRLRNTHALRVCIEQCKVENRENIYDFRNDDIGINYYVYIGESEVGTRSKHSVALQYTGKFGIEHSHPVWMFDVKADYNNRQQHSVNYPDYREQNLEWCQFVALLKRNVLSNKNLFTIGADIGYGTGWGNTHNDGRYQISQEVETLTRTLDMLLMQDYEYHIANRILMGANMCYARHIGQKGVLGFIKLNYNFRKAFDTAYLGNAVQHVVLLQIGCNF